MAGRAGNLPGYPASHGCVRLLRNFSKVLFSVTQLGTPVIIADQNAAQSSVVRPDLIIAHTLHPGTIITVITDLAANPETRSALDFTVITEDPATSGKRRKN